MLCIAMPWTVYIKMTLFFLLCAITATVVRSSGNEQALDREKSSSEKPEEQSKKSNFVLLLVGVFLGLFHVICFAVSIWKAIRDRAAIKHRNCIRRRAMSFTLKDHSAMLLADMRKQASKIHPESSQMKKCVNTAILQIRPETRAIPDYDNFDPEYFALHAAPEFRVNNTTHTALLDEHWRPSNPEPPIDRGGYLNNPDTVGVYDNYLGFWHRPSNHSVDQ